MPLVCYQGLYFATGKLDTWNAPSSVESHPEILCLTENNREYYPYDSWTTYGNAQLTLCNPGGNFGATYCDFCEKRAPVPEGVVWLMKQVREARPEEQEDVSWVFVYYPIAMFSDNPDIERLDPIVRNLRGHHTIICCVDCYALHFESEQVLRSPIEMEITLENLPHNRTRYLYRLREVVNPVKKSIYCTSPTSQ